MRLISRFALSIFLMLCIFAMLVDSASAKDAVKNESGSKSFSDNFSAFIISDNAAISAAAPNPHSQYDAYSTSATISYDHSDWMSSLLDQDFLLDMSIPGSHDSWFFDPMNYDTKLRAGLRAFDFGIGCDSNKNTCGFETVDEPVSGRVYAVAAALSAINNFLVTHPSETVILRLTAMFDNKAETRQNWAGKLAPILLAKLSGKLWIPENGANPYTVKLKEVRGKVVIFRDYSNEVGAPMNIYGLYSSGAEINAHSLFHKHYTSVGNLYEHWNQVRSQLKAVHALHGVKGSGVGALTYLSGSNAIYVRTSFVVSGYLDGFPESTGRTTSLPNIYPDFNRGACTKKGGKGICSVYYTGLNFMLNDALTGRPSLAGLNNVNMRGYKDLGEIMMDYPGESLISAIIKTNTQ
jgi:hypothetical protein